MNSPANLAQRMASAVLRNLPSTVRARVGPRHDTCAFEMIAQTPAGTEIKQTIAENFFESAEQDRESFDILSAKVWLFVLDVEWAMPQSWWGLAL